MASQRKPKGREHDDVLADLALNRSLVLVQSNFDIILEGESISIKIGFICTLLQQTDIKSALLVLRRLGVDTIPFGVLSATIDGAIWAQPVISVRDYLVPNQTAKVFLTATQARRLSKPQHGEEIQCAQFVSLLGDSITSTHMSTTGSFNTLSSRTCFSGWIQ